MKRTFYSLYFKRFLDFNLSLLALIVLSPFLFIIIVFQIIFNGFPLFFVQPRVGKDEKIFKLIKFRTMNNKKDKEGQLLPDVKRRTFFGSILRKTSIDELPSLINILKGDMAIIGPRPLLVEYIPLYNEEQRKRHLVRPGLSGLAQVNGRNAISWKEKFELDVKYLQKTSLFFDVKIIILTILKIISFSNKDIDHSSSVIMEKFKGTF
jgi:undecaprenyl phosphate N,N'-diacetylbacillosamine 1-phosphate transferase